LFLYCRFVRDILNPYFLSLSISFIRTTVPLMPAQWMAQGDRQKMATTSEANENIQPLWQIVSLADYALPAAPTREAAAKGVTALWRLIRSGDSKQQAPERAQDQLLTFSEAQLSRMVPAIDWHLCAESLDVELEDWPEQKEQHSPIRFFIGPPYGGHADMLRLWAKIRRWSVIEPPTPEQILAQNENWLSGWSEHERPWVLPSLERCDLRHADGLTVVRRFFEEAVSGRLGFGLIGCDSWAWSFFQKVWSVPQPETLTLQAFDSQRLKAYFREMAFSSVLGPLRYRESESGRDVLPTSDTEAQTPSTTSPFLKQLAAHSRGILGVAWMYWRNSLCVEPDQTPESDPHADTAEYPVPKNTIWVRAGLKEPVVPLGPTQDIAFVLHCLLLHNGLSVDLLVELLPLSRGVVTATLFLLASAGFVEDCNNSWRVSALGYPVVRQFLKSNGYMVDLF
jgi:hypothetical protein